MNLMVVVKVNVNVWSLLNKAGANHEEISTCLFNSHLLNNQMKDSTAEQTQESEQQHHRPTAAEETTPSESDHFGLVRTVKSKTVHHKHLALRSLQNMNDLVQYHLNSISEHSKLHLWYYLKCPSDMTLPSLEEEAWRQGAPILLNCRTRESHCSSVSC